MSEYNWLWSELASESASIIAAILLTVIFWGCLLKFKKSDDDISRVLVGVFVLSMSFYTFLVLISSQFLFDGPKISLLISEGFTDQRLGWLMLAVILEQIVRFIEFWRTIKK